MIFWRGKMDGHVYEIFIPATACFKDSEHAIYKYARWISYGFDNRIYTNGGPKLIRIVVEMLNNNTYAMPPIEFCEALLGKSWYNLP